MACYSPLFAWQLVSGKVVFVERGDIKRSLRLSCGQCVGCRLERSRQWAIRCMHESQLHEFSSFVTLTYDDDHLGHPSLRYRDFQLFMKRLRRCCGPIRYFMCGEYGELWKRPHFHACLFGVYFADRQYYKELSSGFRLYTSERLSALWKCGFCSIGDVSFESAAYVARYVMKKVYGNRAVVHYREFPDFSTGELIEVVPEFAHMSLKPGIGKGWIERYCVSDVLPRDAVVIRGFASKVPRYYDNYIKEFYGEVWESLEFDRERKAESFSADCSESRLAVREVVVKAKMKSLVRNLE